MDEVEVFLHAGELVKLGYIGISNRYCTIARLDREDWHHILAKRMNCVPADFYHHDGAGLSGSWKESYIRQYSEDRMDVNEAIYKYIKKNQRHT